MSEYREQVEQQWKDKADAGLGAETDRVFVTQPQDSAGNKGVVSRTSLWVPFPMDDLPPRVREVVHAISKSVGVDVTLVLLPLLSAMAGCIGNARRVLLKPGYSQPAVIWTAGIGKSGCGKSPARDAILRPLHTREAGLIRGHEAAMKEYAVQRAAHDAKMKDWVRNGSKKQEPAPSPLEVPVCTRLVVSDVTVEAIAVRLHDSPRGLLQERDELAGWFRSFDQYKSGGKGGDAGHWLSMYDAGTVIVDRKGGEPKTFQVPRAAVSVTGGIQPAILASVLGNEHLENGMAARFLFAMPPQQAVLWTDAGIDEEIERALASIYLDLLAIKPEIGPDGELVPALMGLTPAAKALFVEFNNECARAIPNLHENLAAVYSKLRATAARLALVLHLARTGTGGSGGLVDEASMWSGIQIARWFGQEAQRVYEYLPGIESNRRRLGIIEANGGSVTIRDWQRFTHHETAEEAEADLRFMVEQGLLEVVVVPPGPRGGQSSLRFQIVRVVPCDTTPESSGETGVVSQVDGWKEVP